MAQRATVLFAHGSRNREWAQPFARLRESLGALLPGERIELAFLELMRPSLQECVAALYADGVRRFRVVPVFLGFGGHLKSDLPKLSDELGKNYRDIEITIEPPIGEQPGVIAAIAQAIARRPPAP
jgi:sirohydrochlorin cobaltochelatase